MIILGIDTALRTTGYGVLEVEGKQLRAVDCGVVKNKPKVPHSECLGRLAQGIDLLVESFHPEIAVIEGGFYGRNVRTAMVLGMARGVVVGLLARQGIPVYEYAPRKAKQVVVGYGDASKEQVATVLANALHLDVSDIPNDSTDALSLAVCHVYTQQSHQGLYLPAPL